MTTAAVSLPTATVLEPAPHHSPAWHRQRSLGIGGSDASAILGLNPYRSAFDVWTEKTGKVSHEASPPSEAAYWGAALEGILGEELQTRLREELDEHIRLREQPGTLQHATRTWQIANIDRLVYDESEAPFALAEIKTVGLRGVHDWREPDGIGKHALIQGVHYLAVTGLERAFFGCLVGGQRFIWRLLERDQKLEDYLLEREDKFWQLVVSDTPPPVDGSDATRNAIGRMYPKATGEVLELTPSAAELIAQRHRLTAEIKSAEHARQAVDNALKVHLGEAEIGLLHGEPAVRWTNVTTTRVDTTALKKAMPVVAEKYATTSTTRRFTVPG